MDYEYLRKTIEDSGLKRTYIAYKMGITTRTFYNKVNRTSEWKSKEIEAFCKTLGLTKRTRDDIFFS